MARLVQAEQVRKMFHLDEKEGTLYWREVSKYHAEKNGRIAGGPVHNHIGKEYWTISINKRKYKRSQLVFLYVHGYFPRPMVDHINGNSLDDRPENLRQANKFQNAWNHHKRARRIDLPMGVRRVNTSGRYTARISYFKKQITLGTFDTPIEARQVYLAKRKELYGDFS